MITHGKKHLVSHPTSSRNLILNMVPWHQNVLRKTHQLKVNLLKAKMVTLHQKRSQKEKVTHQRLLLKPLIFLPFTIERLSITYSIMKSNLLASMPRKMSQSLVSDLDSPTTPFPDMAIPNTVHFLFSDIEDLDSIVAWEREHFAEGVTHIDEEKEYTVEVSSLPPINVDYTLYNRVLNR